MKSAPPVDISRLVWEQKYRLPNEDGIGGTWHRVAGALARAEKNRQDMWEARYVEAMRDFKFVPGGRILAGADSPYHVTLMNCFVMGIIEDSMAGIFSSLQEGAITTQKGGGVGYDFSTLRPFGAVAQTTGTVASGPVSFMDVWDAMCATVMSTGWRRGAMMATMRCDHPDIERFIRAKADETRLRHFNLSVLISDAFMDAVERDSDWELVFPVRGAPHGPFETRLVTWSGCEGPVPCAVHKRVRARVLWEKLSRSAYDTGEPGVLFIDRINRMNNLGDRERITSTNPCGEVPLPPYGSCCLGSINLTKFVRAPFSPDARVDLEAIAATACTATRMLDNVIDVSEYPLPAQGAAAADTRRIGLGVTGLADALIMLGLRYDTDEGRSAAAEMLRTVAHAAYRASIELAREKGVFAQFERARFLERPFIVALPEDIRQGIAESGIRNSHLLAIAPAGSISLLASNVSSGIEPIMGRTHVRSLLNADESLSAYELTDYAYRVWQRCHPGETHVPETFLEAWSIRYDDHIEMQAVLQPYVDSSISKTINVAESLPFDQFKLVFDLAYRRGLKGCTTYRAGTGTRKAPPIESARRQDERDGSTPETSPLVENRSG